MSKLRGFKQTNPAEQKTYGRRIPFESTPTLVRGGTFSLFVRLPAKKADISSCSVLFRQGLSTVLEKEIALDEICDGLFGACLELMLTPEETTAFAGDYLDAFAQAKCETGAGTAYGDRIYLNIVSTADTEETWPKDDEDTDNPGEEPDPDGGKSDMKVASKSYSFHATGRDSLAKYGDTYKWMYQSSLTENKQDPDINITLVEAAPTSLPLSLTEAEKASAEELIKLLGGKSIIGVKTHYSIKTNVPITALLTIGRTDQADDIKPLPYMTTLGEATGSAWSLSKTIDYNKFSLSNEASDLSDFPFSADNDEYSATVRALAVLFSSYYTFYERPDYGELAKAIDMPDGILEKAEAAIQAKDETAFAEALSEYEATPAGQKLAAVAADLIDPSGNQRLYAMADLVGFIAAADKTDSATFRFAESPVRLLPNGSILFDNYLCHLAEVAVYALSTITSIYQNKGRTQPFVDVSVSERGMQLDGLGYSFVYAYLTLFALYGISLPADFEVDLSVDVSYLEGK